MQRALTIILILYIYIYKRRVANNGSRYVYRTPVEYRMFDFTLDLWSESKTNRYIRYIYNL